MLRKITLLLFVFSTLCATAQKMNVKGIVKDAASGEILPGVSIVIKGTNTGTETDFDGLYSLSDVTKGATLVFRYLGYKQNEVVVTTQTINVSMEASAESLDEIIVIGYGTQRKKEVTGAVSVVSSESIEQLKPTRIEQALQGQVAGVNVTTSSGSPGAASNIRIRGISTNGDNRPLILVDGNRVEDLSVVNPSDVESINVLKDATAGIYGVQGANGVILITTKTGKKNTVFKSTLNYSIGFQQTTREIPLLNATEYAMLANEAYAANGQALPFSDVSGLGQGTNWQKAAFESAPIYSLDYTLNKGTEKSTYSLGISILDQDGIVGGDKSNFNRRNVKFNFNTALTDKLKLSTSTIYANTNKKNLIESTLGSVLFNALNMPATTPVYDANGNFSLPPAIGTGIEVANPLAQVDNSNNRTWVNKISGSYRLNYQFLDGFTAEARYQYNYAKVNGKTFSPVAFLGNGSVFNNDVPSVNEYEQTYKDYTFDAFVSYENTFDEDHNIKILLGNSIFRTQGVNDSNLTLLGVVGSDLNSVSVSPGAIDNLALSNQPRQFFDSRLLSYFSRLQYNYKGKYLMSAVLRRDGSSNFGPKNKFGFFPTASVGWVVSDEAFLEDSAIINSLKLRASYGVIGNDRIASFGFVSLLTGQGTYVFDNQLTYGTALGAISNPEIKWEKQIPLDVGIDISLFNNKVDITADYFKKTTEDLLLQPQVSGILGVSAPGASAPIVNAGSVVNEGFEFSIGYNQVVSDDFKFSANYNFTTIENNVTFVGNETGIIEGGVFGVGQLPPSRMEAGFPIGYFYGYQTNGIFQTQADVDGHASQTNAAPGDLRFVDTNGDGAITDEDRTYLGDPIADITMGMNFSFNYKAFDFNAYAFASIGNEIVRSYERNLPLTNRLSYVLDRWTGPGTSNTTPRVTTGATGNTLFSDFYVEDGSFLRLQNIQLGYTLDADKLDRLQFDSVRFYVSASNLLTFTKYKGYDPTTSNGSPIGSGIDQGFYPNPKTFLFGVNLNF